MEKKDNIYGHWPIPIGEFYNPEHSKIKKNLLNFFENYKKKNPTRNSTENIYLYESEYNLHELKSDEINKVIKFIQLKVFEVFRLANKNFLLKKGVGKKYNVTVKQSWFIIYDSGGFVSPHIHGDCSWSCVYYVQAGKESNEKNGSTYLQPPNVARLHSGIGSESFGFDVLRFIPDEGKLVVWPSHIVHGSLPYTGSEKRVIISANLIIDDIK